MMEIGTRNTNQKPLPDQLTHRNSNIFKRDQFWKSTADPFSILFNCNFANEVKCMEFLEIFLFLNSTPLLYINFCANNNCSKFFILKKSKIHMRRYFPHISLQHVYVQCLHSTRRRYMVSINMASMKSQHCLPILSIRIILILDRYNKM